MAETNRLLRKQDYLGGSLSQPLNCINNFKNVDTPYSTQNIDDLNLQYVELFIKEDFKFRTRVRMFLPTDELILLRDIVDISDKVHNQCDIYSSSCWNTVDSFKYKLSFYFVYEVFYFDTGLPYLVHEG